MKKNKIIFVLEKLIVFLEQTSGYFDRVLDFV